MTEFLFLSKLSLTIEVLLQWVRDQAAVVWTRWKEIRNPIVVVIIITFISDAVFVCVQLGAVDNCRTVVSGILMPISITEDRKPTEKN